MKNNPSFSHSNHTIASSINAYSKLLMKDYSLTLRLSYNNATYQTKLMEWSDNHISFEAPMQGIDYITLPKDIIIEAIFVSKSALFHTTFRILEMLQKDKISYYRAEIASPIIKKQQREEFRLDVILDTHYKLCTDDVLLTTDMVQGKGTCVNISVGGMCLSCAHQFHAQQLVKLDFTLVGTSLSLIGEVLYLGEPTESGNYMNRIRFIDPDASKSDLLRQLIFEKQRLRLRYQHS